MATLPDPRVTTKDSDVTLRSSLIEKEGYSLLARVGHQIKEWTSHVSRIKQGYQVIYHTFDRLRPLVGSENERLPCSEPKAWNGATSFPIGHYLYRTVFKTILKKSYYLLQLAHFFLASSLMSLLFLCYPRSYPTHTKQHTLNRFIYYLMTITTLCSCLLYPNDSQTHQILRLLPPHERKVFSNYLHFSVSDILIALDSWGERHELAATNSDGVAPEKEGLVCVFQGRHFHYIGKSTRGRAVAGGATRLHEHLLNSFNRKAKEFTVRRYKLARREHRFHLSFMIVLLGPELYTSAAETFLINNIRPGGNGKMSRTPTKRGPRKHRQKRERPWQRTVPESQNPLEQPVAQAWISKHMMKIAADRKARENQDCRQLPYCQNYVQNIRHVKRTTGLVGPLNLFAAENQTLFPQYLSKIQHFEQWEIFVAVRGNADHILFLLDAVEDFTSKSRRRVIRFKIRQGLALYNLPAKQIPTIPVGERTDRVPLQRSLRSTLAKLCVYSKHVCSWVVRKTRFPVAPLRKVSLRRNAAYVARTSQVTDLMSDPELPSIIAEACDGTNLKRVPGSTKFEEPDAVHTQQQQYPTLVGAWAQKVGISKVKRTTLSQTVRDQCVPPPRDILIPEPTSKFLQHLSVPKESVLIPEDKSPAESWCWGRKPYIARLWREVMNAGWRYLPGATPGGAHEVIRDFLIREIPEKFKFQTTRIRHWKKCFCPYIYLSIKLKCWSPLGGTRCKDYVKHACMRKTYSFIQFFNRRWLRKVHRACQCVLEHLSDVSTWQLGRAPNTIRTKFNKLVSIQKFRCSCCHCGKEKAPAAFYAADAGQFYEQVDTTEAIGALERLLWRARRTLHRNTVTVMANNDCFLGGTDLGFAPIHIKQVVFTFSDILLWVAIVLCVCFTQVSGTVFYSRRVPIGSPHGRIAVEAVATESEIKKEQEIRKHGTPLWDPSIPLAQAVLWCRYVDDILLVSRTLCWECLKLLADQTYTVTFKPSEYGDTAIWTDCHFALANDRLVVVPVFKNRDYALNKSDVLEKDSIPSGHTPYGNAVLGSILAGRVRRSLEIIQDDEIAICILWMQVRELLRKQYSVKQVKLALCRIPYPGIRANVFKLINSVKHEFPPPQFPLVPYIKHKPFGLGSRDDPTSAAIFEAFLCANDPSRVPLSSESAMAWGGNWNWGRGNGGNGGYNGGGNRNWGNGGGGDGGGRQQQPRRPYNNNSNNGGGNGGGMNQWLTMMMMQHMMQGSGANNGQNGNGGAANIFQALNPMNWMATLNPLAWMTGQTTQTSSNQNPMQSMFQAMCNPFSMMSGNDPSGMMQQMMAYQMGQQAAQQGNNNTASSSNNNASGSGHPADKRGRDDGDQDDASDAKRAKNGSSEEWVKKAEMKKLLEDNFNPLKVAIDKLNAKQGEDAEGMDSDDLLSQKQRTILQKALNDIVGDFSTPASWTETKERLLKPPTTKNDLIKTYGKLGGKTRASDNNAKTKAYFVEAIERQVKAKAG